MTHRKRGRPKKHRTKKHRMKIHKMKGCILCGGKVSIKSKSGMLCVTCTGKAKRKYM